MPCDMPHASAEAAAHAQGRALVAGDFGTAIRGMTAEGLASAMAVGNSTWNVAGYEVIDRGAEGDDQVFDLVLETDLGPLTLRERFRHVDGDWKAVSIERAGALPGT